MIEKKSVFGYGYGSKKTAFNGIINYIQKYHDELIPSSDKKYFTRVNNLMKEFLLENGCIPSKKNTYYHLDKNAAKIQNRWKEFKTFLKNKSC